MPHVQLGGLNLHIQERGSGPPVVLIHGLLVGNLASYYFTLAPPLSVGHRVLMYDLRGHGRSARTETGYDLGTQVQDLAALLDHWRVPRADLVGHSYGARIAMQMALEQPERVGRLVLIEPPLSPGRVDGMERVAAMKPDDVLAILPKDLQAALQRGKRAAERLREGLGGLLLETDLGATAASMPDLSDPELARIPHEALAIFGTESPCAPAGPRMVSKMPRCRLLHLQGGHYLLAERPRELGEAVTAFLKPEAADA